MKLKTDPWKHILLYDFLAPDDFISLREIAKERIRGLKDEKVRIVKTYDSYGKELSSVETNDDGYDLDFKGLFESYFEISKSILAFIDPSKATKIKKINFEIQSVCANYNYEIHHDRLDKLLSIVIYLDPDHNYGTFIYESKDSLGHEIEWILNSGIAFSAVKNRTWHSFKSNSQRRTTFNINLYDRISK